MPSPGGRADGSRKQCGSRAFPSTEMADEFEDVREVDEDERREVTIRPVALRSAVDRLRDVLVEPLTEEEKYVLDDFNLFRQQHPFNLKSLDIDIDIEQ